MNAKHARDVLVAAAACDPGGSYDGPQALVAALAEALPEAEWELAVSGGDPSALRLGLRACGELDAARAALAGVLSLDEARFAGAPQAGRSWVDARWDAKAGRWGEIAVPSGARQIRAKRFAAADFEEPVASALKAFDELAEIATVQTQAGRPGWTMVLAKPLPWPLFLRCDLASSFAPRAAQLSLLLRDARVAALDFDGEALWARCVG